MTSENPYHLSVEKVLGDVRTYDEIRAKGGKFTPSQLDDLLGRTAALVQGAEEHVQRHLADLNNPKDSFEGNRMTEGPNILKDYFEDSQTADLVNAKARWKESLRATQEQIDPGVDHRHEVELLDALIDVLDSQPTSLPADSPYSLAFHTMLDSIDYAPFFGLPQVMGLALSQDEFWEHFRDLLTGRASFVQTRFRE